MKLIVEKEIAKLSGSGTLKYGVFVDEKCELYIQLVQNNIGTPKPGTHTSLFFEVRRYADQRNSTATLAPLHGIERSGGQLVPSGDRNDPGFLKAALQDLLP